MQLRILQVFWRSFLGHDEKKWGGSISSRSNKFYAKVLNGREKTVLP